MLYKVVIFLNVQFHVSYYDSSYLCSSPAPPPRLAMSGIGMLSASSSDLEKSTFNEGCTNLARMAMPPPPVKPKQLRRIQPNALPFSDSSSTTPPSSGTAPHPQVSSVPNVTCVLSPANASEHVSWLVKCCGSSALSPLSLLAPCAPFTRLTSFSLLLSPGLVTYPEPPSRVTDLHVTLITRDSVTLTWSSDDPLVTSSSLLISDNISLLLGPGSQLLTSDQVTRSRRERGQETSQSHELCLKSDYGNNFYIGLISETGANITGRISNLVSVMLPERSEAGDGTSRR